MEYLESLSASPVPIGQLRAHLVDRAVEEGIVDGLYRSVETPIGAVMIVTSPHGVVRLGFPHEKDVIEKAAAETGPRIFAAPAAPAPSASAASEAPDRTAAFRSPALDVLDAATTEISEYFAGTRRNFDVPIDLRLHGFRGEVVRELGTIGYGERASYKALAQQVGNPGAVRAVGSACANNPVPIFLPCHRVVRSDGTWGNYRGGSEAKTYLLNLERAG